MQKITPFLCFDGNAEEAMNYYTSIFSNAKVSEVVRYMEGGPGPVGTVMTASFTLEGQTFTVLNGGTQFNFTEAISFVVHCDTQEEVDHYWAKLTADGGEESWCGWLKDKYGLSWQITPGALLRMIKDPNTAKSARAMQAMMKMRKIDLATIQAAYDAD